MPRVWTSQIAIDKKNREVTIFPVDIKERKEIEKSAKETIDKWRKAKEILVSDLFEERIELPYPARIGGGVILTLETSKNSNDLWFVLQMRTKDAPACKFCMDITAAGIPDTTSREERNFQEGKLYISIPQIVRLLSEFYSELGIILGNSNSKTLYISIPRSIPKEVEEIFINTALNNYTLLPTNIKPPIIYIDHNIEIGKFKNGYNIKEMGLGKGETIFELREAAIYVEEQSGSMEIISPWILSLFGKEFYLWDVQLRECKPIGVEIIMQDLEAIGEFDYHEKTIIPKVTLLDRYIILLSVTNPHSSKGVITYKSGKKIFEGSLYDWFSTVGLEDALRAGMTPGLTSKMEALSLYAEKGISINFEGREGISLKSFLEVKRLRDELYQRA